MVALGSLHKFAGFSAFHLNRSKPFVCPILLRSGNESLSDTNLVVSYKLGQVNTVNYLKIPKEFCFGVLTLKSLGFYHKNSHELIVHSGFRQENI